MSAKFRWGIIGPGRIAHKFATAIPFSKNGVLQAVASTQAYRAKEFAKRFSAPNWFEGYEAMLRSGEIDAVYIATPHPFHFENVLMALELGVPVLCEKPLGLNAKQVEQMIAAHLSHHTFLMEGMWTRFLPHVIQTKTWIDAGLIGKPTIYQADFGIMLPFNPKGRHFDLELGGGAMVDIGIYPLFMGMYLFGEPTAYCGYASLGATGADISFTMSMQFKGDVLGSICASYQAHGSVEAVVAGTLGRLKLQSHWFRPSNVEHTDTSGNTKIHHFHEPSNGFQYEIDEVERCVRLGYLESDLYPLQFSLRMARIMDAMRASFGVRYSVD